MSDFQASKILVIEDETTQRILVKEYLEESGYIVRLADDGRRGLEMASQLVPDLIILDLFLPTLDGYTLCTRLKQDPATADIPVILITASREDDVIERGLAAGASDFVTKPVDWSYLSDRVAHVLQQSEDIKRLTAEKNAREQELQALLQTAPHPAHPVDVDENAYSLTAANADTVSRDDHEKELHAVRTQADERVRQVETAARERIQADAENAARMIEDMKRSFWSVIASTTDAHVNFLTALDQLTSGTTDEDAIEAETEVPATVRQENAVQSLLTSTRNLKLLSQYMTGNVQLDEHPIDLVALIAETMAQVKPDSEHRRLVLEADVPDSPVPVMADESQIRYAVLSMLINAFKFCPPNGTVRIALTAEPGQPVQLRIHDNGVGIAPALVENLHGCAAYPANARCHQSGRLGFGIPMSTAIMNLHG
ncbi:MAG: hybrid sensor histidine kinase/response regulator [Hyphomicrobiaceae bacterium]